MRTSRGGGVWKAAEDGWDSFGLSKGIPVRGKSISRDVQKMGVLPSSYHLGREVADGQTGKSWGLSGSAGCSSA